jgi:hypothetical protein
MHTAGEYQIPIVLKYIALQPVIILTFFPQLLVVESASGCLHLKNGYIHCSTCVESWKIDAIITRAVCPCHRPTIQILAVKKGAFLDICRSRLLYNASPT